MRATAGAAWQRRSAGEANATRSGARTRGAGPSAAKAAVLPVPSRDAESLDAAGEVALAGVEFGRGHRQEPAVLGHRRGSYVAVRSGGPATSIGRRTVPAVAATQAPVRGTAGEPLSRGVWAIAGGLLVLLLVLAGRYGWHRDELYFRVAGRHLDWGYIDQPPFTPLLARLASEVADGNLFVLRFVPAVAVAATVVLGAALVRELGGSRRAQVVGAGVVAASGYVLGTGHLLATSTFDLLAWMAALVLGARLLRTDEPRWWPAIGVVVGAAMLNKNLVVLLVASLLVGLAVERRWRLLVTPWAVAGAAIAIVLAAPNLAWQAANGWPQLDMADALAERLAAENRLTLLPLQVLFFGPVVAVLLWRGAAWLARAPEARPLRPLLWAWPVGLALTFATAGRPYYVFPLTLAVGLAGVVASERVDLDLRRLARLAVINGVVSALLALPVLPRAWAATVAVANETAIEQIGWPELADQVGAVVASLPEEERDRAVVLAASYGEAGALDLHGEDLPPVFSGHNSYADFDRPADDGATVVAVRYPAARIGQYFERCEQVATIRTPHDVPNEIEGTPIHVCRGLRGTWAEVWDRLRHLS
jgi:hypothetical protein